MAAEKGFALDVSGPSPGPTPGPTPSPSPSSPGGQGPQPTPSPSPGPSPRPRAPWGSEPDVGVTPGWLRDRADDCDTAATAVKQMLGPSEDAFEDLARAAEGWEFTGSIRQIQGRWEDLDRLVRNRLEQAADNFRLSADGYTTTEAAHADRFRGLMGKG